MKETDLKTELKKLIYEYFGNGLQTLDIRSVVNNQHLRYLRVPTHDIEITKVTTDGTLPPVFECKISDFVWNKDFLAWNDRKAYKLVLLTEKQVKSLVDSLEKEIKSLTCDQCEGCALNAKGENLPFSCYGPQCYNDDPFHCVGPTKDDEHKREFWKRQSERYGASEETLKKNVENTKKWKQFLEQA